MSLRLWPQRYALLRLPVNTPAELPSPGGERPVGVVKDGQGSVLFLPEEQAAQWAGSAVAAKGGLRLLTLEVSPETPFSPLLAKLTNALAEVAVELVAWPGAGGWHLLVEEGQLGRALAALHQARVEESPA